MVSTTVPGKKNVKTLGTGVFKDPFFNICHKLSLRTNGGVSLLKGDHQLNV